MLTLLVEPLTTVYSHGRDLSNCNPTFQERGKETVEAQGLSMVICTVLDCVWSADYYPIDTEVRIYILCHPQHH